MFGFIAQILCQIRHRQIPDSKNNSQLAYGHPVFVTGFQSAQESGAKYSCTIIRYLLKFIWIRLLTASSPGLSLN